MKRANQQDFDPDEPIAVTPANHPALSDGATIVKVAMAEAVGVGINHAFNLPWWAGAQLAVAYLFWRLMHERAFYTRIVVAWNKRLAPERRSDETWSIEDANRFIERMNKRDAKD